LTWKQIQNGSDGVFLYMKKGQMLEGGDSACPP
jgi:hypothetical protein